MWNWSGTGAGFLRVQFPLPILILPISSHSVVNLSSTMYVVLILITSLNNQVEETYEHGNEPLGFLEEETFLNG
jgi:hypothetical protein